MVAPAREGLFTVARRRQQTSAVLSGATAVLPGYYFPILARETEARSIHASKSRGSLEPPEETRRTPQKETIPVTIPFRVATPFRAVAAAPAAAAAAAQPARQPAASAAGNLLSDAIAARQMDPADPFSLHGSCRSFHLPWAWAPMRILLSLG
eukprot:gene8140-biopygen742